MALLFGLQCGCCSKICKIGIEVDQWINIRNIWTNLIEPGNFQTDKNVEYLKVIEGKNDVPESSFFKILNWNGGALKQCIKKDIH